jgi:hypothetical protein
LIFFKGEKKTLITFIKPKNHHDTQQGVWFNFYVETLLLTFCKENQEGFRVLGGQIGGPWDHGFIKIFQDSFVVAI